MATEIKVAQLPESVSDATLVGWHKKVGDTVQRDENLADLETDKVVLEVPAPVGGVLAEIRIADGTTVTEGELLAIIDESATGASPSAPAADTDATDDTAPTEPQTAKAASDDRAAHKLSPAVRRLVEEHDLDVSMITGSGKGGRINKADVLRFIDSQQQSDVVAEDGEAVTEVRATDRMEERVPMSRLRARVAERLIEAQATAAMLTTFNEVDLTEVIALRSRYKEEFIEKYDVKLGFMSFFVKAACEALAKFPVVNASVEGTDILYHNYQDVGIAVSTDRGLLVPVLRDAGQMSFAEIETGINALGRKARDGSIGIDDLTGGTFTVTNGGIFGSMMSTPIINPPQSAILGMHNIQQRPMVVDGNIEARPMMYLALTYDHRIIDGRESVQFLVSIKQALENPERLLLGL
ncbi:MAG: 2-oxoglutarate dehydrogenase complex dihydrolipoyllysine-residue succinyltransferase [Pseudomonadota bacterium]